jgi:hypothetical protein
MEEKQLFRKAHHKMSCLFIADVALHRREENNSAGRLHIHIVLTVKVHDNRAGSVPWCVIRRVVGLLSRWHITAEAVVVPDVRACIFL